MQGLGCLESSIKGSFQESLERILQGLDRLLGFGDAVSRVISKVAILIIPA